MTIPIIQSKFSIPTLPANYLSRPRLDQLWEKWRHKRLVQITAGAGFGKTSFLSANVRDDKRTRLWYFFDDIDSNLATFCGHLLEAIDHTSAHLPPSIRIIAPQNMQISDSELPSFLLSHLIRAIRADKRDWVLVFDDLHRISTQTEILRFLERLIRFLPEGSTIILSSREPVEIATMKTRAAGGMAALTSRDLKFNSTEVAAVFEFHYPDLSLPPRLCRKIVTKTEGWAAGIEIFLQALPSPAPRLIEETLHRLTNAGSGWFSYFAEEVLRSLDSKTRHFLLRTSILPRLESRLCNRLLTIRNSHTILANLCTRNLFTFLAEDNSDTYNYHHLFREFLLNQLKNQLGPDEFELLQQQAAAALLRAGATVEAMAAYAGGNNPEAVVKLVSRFESKLLSTGQYEIIHQALSTVPAPLLAQYPKAMYILGRACEILGRWEEAEKIYRKSLRLDNTNSTRVELMSLIAQLQMRRGKYRACINLCCQALSSPGRKTMNTRARLLSVRGLAECALGKLSDGEKDFLSAESVYRKRGFAAGEARILYLLAVNVYYQRGEFQTAKDMARRALVIFKKEGERRRLCVSLGVLGFIMATMGEEREARDLTEDALRLAESLDYPIIEGYCHNTLGHCALLTGDPVLAAEHFNVSVQIGELLGEASLQIIPHLGLAEAALVQEDYFTALHNADLARNAAITIKDLFHEAIAYRLLGSAAYKSSPDKALKYWSRGKKICRRINATYELHRLLLTQLACGSTPTDKQKQILTELLSGTARRGHDFLYTKIAPESASLALPPALLWEQEVEYVTRIIINLGAHVCSFLALLITNSTNDQRSRIVKILAQIGGSDAHRILTDIAGATQQTASSAVEAADELARIPAVALKIQALGPLVIAVDNHCLSASSWRSARALRLCQLLLVHRFRWVPRDVLLEMLWPEIEPEKSGNNLWQSVHQLRKILEPGLKSARDSRYVRFHNGACRLEPGENYFYDVEEFESELVSARKLWSAGKRRAAKPHLDRAVSLYQGDFLAENPYEEFATEEREGRRDSLLRCIEHLLELLTNSRSWDQIIPLCRQGLEMDSYHEEFYRYLIQAQLKLGNRHEALTDYHRYEEMMIRELDLLPTTQMKNLADQATALS